jgi:hypothetical protein
MKNLYNSFSLKESDLHTVNHHRGAYYQSSLSVLYIGFLKGKRKLAEERTSKSSSEIATETLGCTFYPNWSQNPSETVNPSSTWTRPIRHLVPRLSWRSLATIFNRHRDEALRSVQVGHSLICWWRYNCDRPECTTVRTIGTYIVVFARDRNEGWVKLVGACRIASSRRPRTRRCRVTCYLQVDPRCARSSPVHIS